MVHRTAVVERCGVAIVKREEDGEGRRVVFGEVMLPLKRYEPGQKVPVSELQGLVHYDGGCMTASEIKKLSDRFAKKRCRIDVEHDGEGRKADVVENFIAGRGWEPWTEGAWVVGTQVGDDDLWQRTGVDLHAYSIQFVVRIEDVPIIVVMEDGSEVERTLHYFVDTHPQFLSFVGQPATGAMWKIKERGATSPAIVPIVKKEWDRAAAFDRVKAWAGEDTGRLAQAHAMFDATNMERGALIGDIDNNRLVVVRAALDEARRSVALSEADAVDRRRAMAQLSYYDKAEIDRGVVPFQDLPLADVERAWDSDEARARVVAEAGGDEWDPEKVQRAHVWYDSDKPDLLGSYKLPIADMVDGKLTAVPRAVFAAAGRLGQTDVPASDLDGIREHLGRYYEKMDRPAPWDEEARAEDVGGGDGDGDSITLESFLTTDAGTVYDGFDALTAALASVPAGDESTGIAKALLQEFLAWGVSRIDDDGALTFAENQAQAPEENDVDRAMPSFAEMAAEGELADGLWRAAQVFTDLAMSAVYGMDVEDRAGQIRKAINDFSAYANALVDRLKGAGFFRSRQEAPDEPWTIDRKGAKMAKARLEELTAAVGKVSDAASVLQALVEQLQPPAEGDGDGVIREADGKQPPEPAEKQRSAPDAAELLRTVQEQASTIRDLAERLDTIEGARGAPSYADGRLVTRSDLSPMDRREELRSRLRGSLTQPQ